MRNEVTNRILEIVNYYLKYDLLTGNDLDEDLVKKGLESIAFVSIVVAIEDAFSVEIPDKYLLISEMNTINKIKNIIDSLK